MRVDPSHRKVCRACQADIIFAETNRLHQGQPVVMPVNAEPADNGNIYLTRSGDQYYAGAVRKNQAAGMRDAGHELHLAHFATCTQPARFRKHYGDGGKT